MPKVLRQNGQKGENMEYTGLNLQMFADEGAAEAAPAPDMGQAAAEPGTEMTVNAGGELGDGTKVPDAQVAAALRKQRERHPELKKVYGRNQKAAAPGQAPVQAAKQQPAQPAGDAQPDAGEKSLEERWNELKKGEFKDLFAKDQQDMVNKRFKNQEDSTKKLEGMQPMLDALMKKAGVQSVEELSAIVLDDDSLYEEEAEAAGMTVARYKEYQALKQEHEANQQREQENIQEQMRREHFSKLWQQGEEFKKRFPDFDLKTELQNPDFARIVHPSVGGSVEQAYFATHYKEMMPQAMAYGMQRAQEQMSQTIQARQNRPVEGAMRQTGQAQAQVKLNPATMTRAERARVLDMVRRGQEVSFD